jgi:hypothetical protein
MGEQHVPFLLRLNAPSPSLAMSLPDDEIITRLSIDERQPSLPHEDSLRSSCFVFPTPPDA